MLRFRSLLFIFLIPFGLTSMATGQDAATPTAPIAAVIEIPRLDGIVGAPSPDLLPPIVNPPAPIAAAIAPEPVKPAVEAATSTSVIVEPAKIAEPVKAVDAPPQAPIFALAAELSERVSRDKTVGVMRDDRDAALKFYEARQGVPKWLTEAGFSLAAQGLIAEISKAGDYGLAADAFKLPTAVSAGASKSELADAEATLTFAALKYARHARGGRVDPQALSKAIDRKAQLLPPSKALETLALAIAPDVALRGFHPQHPQFEKLRQKYLAVKAGESVLDQPAAMPIAEPAKGKKAATAPAPKILSPAAVEKKLLANMEMYRWMPTFGSYYIQPNIPEFLVRVVKDGHVIHTERIVTGKPETMTPTFSDEMRLVVFKPFWNVPESIKFKELQPQLLRSGSALSKAGLRAEINGRPVDEKSFDWSEADMRQVHIFQPPGDANALGRVKFLFPNKHDVYLHDTPSKGLFANTTRAYSHGCVRVRDPLKLAEVILSNDKKMSRPEIDRLAGSGPDNNEIKLGAPIPIHLTYFTAWVDDAGKLHTAPDIYGHENRVHMGLDGKTHLIAQPREEKYVPPSSDDRRRFAEARKQQKQLSNPVETFMKSIFNF
jgi:L,D-transpeptidase YcbB